ncbi:MAG: SDR family NAD(P)-dependent oxidoreductase [Vicinamibacterales bacterium]
MGRKVLVTGAGGFIASHLVERLVLRGDSVRALVHYNSANHWFNLDEVDPEYLREVEVVPGDVTDADVMQRAVSGIDAVFHLAALIGIPYSYMAPRSYVQVNVVGTMTVAQACLNAGVGRLVHVSTSEAYGSAQYVPMDERHPLQAQSPYSATKIAADKMIESYWHSFGLPACIVRPFNTYGPRQSARAIVPTIITQALAGDEISLGSTTPIRDLTYVTDTADGLIAAAGSTEGVGQTVNLGSGQGVSIAELVDVVGQLIGRRLHVRTDARRLRPATSEVDRLISDNSKAGTVLGWRPRVTLQTGLERTIEYLERRLSSYKVKEYVV